MEGIYSQTQPKESMPLVISYHKGIRDAGTPKIPPPFLPRGGANARLIKTHGRTLLRQGKGVMQAYFEVPQDQHQGQRSNASPKGLATQEELSRALNYNHRRRPANLSVASPPLPLGGGTHARKIHSMPLYQPIRRPITLHAPGKAKATCSIQPYDWTTGPRAYQGQSDYN